MELVSFRLRVRFPEVGGGGLGIFLFTTASRTAPGPAQFPIQSVPGALSLGVKRPGCEADHSPAPSAEVKNAWIYTSTPPIRLHGVVLSSKKRRVNFTDRTSNESWQWNCLLVSLLI
jgi:hypothetical protein